MVGLYFDRNYKTSMCDINEQRKQECIKHSVYHYVHFYTFNRDNGGDTTPKYTKYFKSRFVEMFYLGAHEITRILVFTSQYCHEKQDI